VPLALTGYEWGLLLAALAFIVFALVVALVVPRSRPTFPGRSLGWFIAACIVFFVVQMGAVVLLAEVGEAHETAAEHEPGTTEPAPTTPTETTPTETTPTETETTETTDTTETGTTDTTETTETEPTETTETETTETTETAEPLPPADLAAGRTVFVTNACGGCHTLADAGANGTIGPNLDESAPSMALVVERVTNGTGVMPAFGDRLSEQQIRDVAAYVSSGPSRASS
jgi:cytochrome c553